MKDKIKWILTLIAFILVALTLAGIICGWFTPKTDETAPEEEKTESSFIVTPTSTDKISLSSKLISAEDFAVYAIPPTAESSFVLTATVEPADAFNQNVDFSVSFVNPDSEWAKGKTATDYVKTTAVSGSKNSATVSCVSAFAEQIKVTATSRDNGASASCVCDYVKRIEHCTFSENFNDFDDEFGFDVYATYGEGTIEPNVYCASATLNIDDEFISSLESHLSFSLTFKAFKITEQEDIANTGIVLKYTDVILNWESLTEDQQKAVYYSWFRTYQDEGYSFSVPNAKYDIQIIGEYNGKKYSDYQESEMPCSMSGSAFGSDVQIGSVGLDTPKFAF